MTRDFVSAAGLADHIAVVEGDAMRETRAGQYDLITMRALLQVTELKSAKAYACDVTDPSAVEAAFVAVRAELAEVP